MEAFRFDPKTKKAGIERVPIPKIEKDDDILVEVAYAGICGTDLHIITGEFPTNPNKVTLGHEFSGVVREVGAAVTHVKPGDRIMCDPQVRCGTCYYCSTARYHHCGSGGVKYAVGIGNNGGFAKYCILSPMQAYKLPDNLSLKQGVLGEPMSCIYWGLKKCFDPTPVGSKILVVGAGIIGNLWSALLHHLGHRRVTVVEPSAARLEINRKLGTGFETVTPEELGKRIKAGERFDVAVDCSGNTKAIEQALSSLSPCGKLALFGVAPQGQTITLAPFFMYERELTISASNINPFSTPWALGLMEAMADKYLDYQKLGVKEFDLKDYENAMATLKSASVSKAVFAINPNLDKK